MDEQIQKNKRGSLDKNEVGTNLPTGRGQIQAQRRQNT